MTTLVSPTSTTPTRWWMATSTQRVPLLQDRRDPLHLGLGHPFVGLVLEPDHLAAARLRARRAGEGGDRARVVGGDLAHGVLERERLLGEPEGAAGDGRDQRHLVARGEHAVARGVGLVDGDEQARRLVAEGERRPHVSRGRALGKLDLGRARPRQLPQSREQADTDPHAAQRSPGLADRRWLSCYI